MKQRLFIRRWSGLVAFFFLSTINLKIVLHSHDNTHLQNQETRWPIFNWIYLPLQCKFASFIMKYFLCSKYYGLCNYLCIPASLVVLIPRISGLNIKKRPVNPSFLVLQMRKQTKFNLSSSHLVTVPLGEKSSFLPSVRLLPPTTYSSILFFSRLGE